MIEFTNIYYAPILAGSVKQQLRWGKKYATKKLF